jgi:hypothetical protein
MENVFTSSHGVSYEDTLQWSGYSRQWIVDMGSADEVAL